MMRMNDTPFYRPYLQKPKKVVSIPVHFVGSTSDSDSDSDSDSKRNNSAIRIQKVARGFMVRNTMRKIKEIGFELEQIETRVSCKETNEVLRKEQRERVRVGESIMNLLMKLDSVRVLTYYSGVRDLRKCVIKKAIKLQEVVDDMVDPTPSREVVQDGEEEEGEGVGPTRELAGDNVDEVEEKDKEMVDRMGGSTSNGDDAAEVKMERREENKEEDGEGEGVGPTEELTRDDMRDRVVRMEPIYDDRLRNNASVVLNQDENESEDENDVQLNCGRKKLEGSDNEAEKMELEEKEDLGTREETQHKDEHDDCDGNKLKGSGNKAKKMVIEEKEYFGAREESVATSLVEEVEENCVAKEEEDKHKHEDYKGSSDDGNKKSRELLEKMVEDNERVMGMMAQLFEKNEKQTKLLSSLSQRVEQVERAFTGEKLRRKKRKNSDAKHLETGQNYGCI